MTLYTYTQIFSSAGIISIISVALVVVLKNKVSALTNHNSKV